MERIISACTCRSSSPVAPHPWLVLAVYGLLVLVWYAVGKRLGRHALILKSVDRWGHWFVPFVLIGLGSYILMFMSQ